MFPGDVDPAETAGAGSSASGRTLGSSIGPHPAPLLRAARRTSLIDQVIAQLRHQILEGVWQIGTRIPTEAELAALTGTSRNTVREAVQSLVHSGLLERRQGSGTYVLASSELAGAMGRRVAVARHLHVLEVRRALEVEAARLAALRRTEEDIAAMRDLVLRRNGASHRGDAEAVVSLDVELHRTIAAAAHNPVLGELYLDLLGALQDNVRHNVDARGGVRDDEHVALIEAIATGDAELAATEAAGFLDQLMSREDDAATQPDPSGG